MAVHLVYKQYINKMYASDIMWHCYMMHSVKHVKDIGQDI